MGAFHFGTIAEVSGQPRGDCPYRMGQWAKVKCSLCSDQLLVKAINQGALKYTQTLLYRQYKAGFFGSLGGI